MASAEESNSRVRSLPVLVRDCSPASERAVAAQRPSLFAQRAEIEQHFLNGWSDHFDEPGVGRADAELLGQEQFVVGAFEGHRALGRARVVVHGHFPFAGDTGILNSAGSMAT